MELQDAASGRIEGAAVDHKAPEQVVTVVSGLPRSGTSMMMKMLEAGGLPMFIDGIRRADEDNPKGYFELERVKKLDKGEDKGWVKEAAGKGIKVISALLTHLPSEYDYKVIFMRRKMQEILASQRQMLIRRGERSNGASDETMATLFKKHLAKTMTWLDQQPHMAVMYVDYNQLIERPHPYVDEIHRFLGGALRRDLMLAAIDPALYRQRT